MTGAELPAMTTINTIEDLIRLLDENPEWVEALRVRLLTRELIELPQTFAKFAAATNERLTRLETDVGHLKGWALESRLHSRIVPLISQKLGVRRAEIMRSPVREEIRPALRDPVEDSVDAHIIGYEEEQRVAVTDFILKAIRRGTASPVWVAIEVSSKVRSDDIVRALETSHILTKVFEEEAVPVVAGYAIDPPDQQQADESGVVYIEVNEDWG